MARQSKVLLTMVLCAAVVAGVSAVQPGCRTRFEMRTKWAVQGNFMRYWECARWGKAVQKTCPLGTLFAQPFQTCEPTRSWEEFPYYLPPTSANDFADECTEELHDCENNCLDVPCDFGIVVDNQCECPGGWVDRGGVCIDPNVELVCPEHWVIRDGQCVDPATICESGFILVDGVCTDCIDSSDVNFPCVGGQIVQNQCQCFGAAALVDGVCIANPEVIYDCGVNGAWDATLSKCVCNAGHQFINGWCVSTFGICDGAPESAYARGSMDCEAPECTEEQYWANTHWPTKNPRFFWQCPGVNWVQEMPCGAGTCFSYKEQVCVHAHDWINECQ